MADVITWDNIGYGAMDDSAIAEEESYRQEIDYQLGQSYYRTDSPKVQRKKCAESFIPLLMFAVILTVFALMFSEKFDHLYPGGHNKSTTATNTKPDNIVFTSDDSDGGGTYPGTLNQGGYDTESDDACVNYPNCSSLSGKCCPTEEGVVLECCKG